MIKEYLSLIRVSHWIKNSIIFVPLIFSKHLFMHFQLFQTGLAFISFSALASSIYIFNDIIDVERDRQHPLKKNRPIASGKIAKDKAVIISIFLLLCSILVAINFDYRFILVIAGYFILNISYSIFLKKIVILDLLSIALGFMLRVFAGAIAIDVGISKWLILTTLFISLFLAVMKRRSELVNIDTNLNTRKVLEDYSLEFINQIISITAAGVIISYALYTVSARTVAEFHTERLIYTSFFVIFGIFRYIHLVYKKSMGENAVEVLVKDKPMIINILFYVITVIAIIYL